MVSSFSYNTALIISQIILIVFSTRFTENV